MRTARVVIATVLTAAASAAHSQQVGRSSIAVEVQGTPTPMFALGRAQLVYEVRLTNFGAEVVTLVQLDALDSAAAPLGSWKDSQLAQRLGRIGNTGSPPPANLLEVLQLQPGRPVVAYLLAVLLPGKIAPASIQHRLTIRTSGSTYTILTIATPTTAAPLPQLSAPVADGPWVAIRGPSNSSGHRLSYVVQDGAASIPQRYAVDWAKLGPDGKLFHDDSTKLQNWYGYGASVSAVAAGTVVWVRDGVAERAPFDYVAPAVIEAADAVGNSVILDIGGGQYATFAHLKPGSLKVKKGDRVALGQVIGELGNSGNSLGPHLHFHVSTAPAPLAGEGRPFVIPSFELLGRVASTALLLGGAPWTQNPAQPSRVVMLETPLENMVVRFAR